MLALPTHATIQPMSKRSSKQSRKKQRRSNQTAASSGQRVALAAILPLVGALALSALVGGVLSPDSEGSAAPFFAGLGTIAWFIGLRWYGIKGMGLRGGRPLFAGIGFATLAWIALLIFRFIFPTISAIGVGTAVAGRAFIFLLLFEAFALQIWTFGTLFRAISDWRGPLTAAVGSGLVFGTIGSIFFQEVFVSNWSSLLFFGVWGILYGIIRLRTGSLLGMVILQALQSFTTWTVLLPDPIPLVRQLTPMYVATAVAYAIFIWRLWPKEEEDYRV